MNRRLIKTGIKGDMQSEQNGFIGSKSMQKFYNGDKMKDLKYDSHIASPMVNSDFDSPIKMIN
jgi:hypothetical protein